MTTNKYVASLLNFFLLGLGYIYHGKKIILGVFLTLGAIFTIYVELQLKAEGSPLYNFIFAGFFLLSLGTTIDIYLDIKNEN